LQLPAAGQFFVIEGKDEEAVLEAEESMEPQLDAMRQSGSLGGYQAVCNFVPSAARQHADAALLQRRLFAPHALVQKFFDALQSPALGRKACREAKPSAQPLNVGLWLASPLAAPFRGLWLGQSDGQMAAILSFSAGPAGLDLKALEALAKPEAGISFVDHFAALDAMMGSFRQRVAWLLLLGYLLVSLFVAWIYGPDGWRAMAPALLGALLVAGLFGWLGLNFNLFSVFGILLSLDMGVDYGIFMQDRQSGEFPVALLSASLAALSTLLSFGLLCLSRTPALQVFGLSVLLGIGASWLLAPAFTKESKHEQS
jgi:predicted exporter